MKRHLSYGVLLAADISLSASSSPLTEMKDTQPLKKQPQANTQAVLTSIPTIGELTVAKYLSK